MLLDEGMTLESSLRRLEAFISAFNSSGVDSRSTLGFGNLENTLNYFFFSFWEVIDLFLSGFIELFFYILDLSRTSGESVM